MPELPEVETVRRGLAPVMEGALIVEAKINRADLRFPFPANLAGRLTGRTVTALSRRAKYLLADLDDGHVLLSHLGMSGSYRMERIGRATTLGDFHVSRGSARKHDHVILRLAHPGHGVVVVTYNDPRRFGMMDLVARGELETHRLIAGLGIEPTGNELDGPQLGKLFAPRRTSLKAALLDQRLVAGLGNIYVCEALWAARLSPQRPASSLVGAAGQPLARASHLANAIREIIARAIAAGGSSLRDHRQVDGETGYFQHDFMVYDRENQPCRRERCRGVVCRVTDAGRSSFYCPTCQK